MPLPNSITFFYPSRIVGGAEYLFIRMAKYLAEHTQIKVYVVDYRDGFLRQQLTGSGVTIIDFTTKEQLSIDYDTVIVTPFNHLLDVVCFKANANVKVLFWSIHPTHFTSYFDNRNWFVTQSDKEVISQAFREMIEKGSMVFMDYPNYDTNNLLLNLSVNTIPYLPITCNAYDGEKKSYKPGDEINICWLGRIATDKVASIINIAQHINRLPDEVRRTVSFIIIGNGEEEKTLTEVLKGLEIKYSRIGTMINDDLNKFLVQHVDLGFAMGTSALEFAKLKIPVVLADLFPGNIPVDNKFEWLFSSKGFSLGSYYSDSTKREYTLSEILAVCNTEETYDQTSDWCYRYYADNFEISAISTKLLEYLSGEHLVSIKSHELLKISRIMNPWFFLLLKKIKSYVQKTV